jgi:hypothetical protein
VVLRGARRAVVIDVELAGTLVQLAPPALNAVAPAFRQFAAPEQSSPPSTAICQLPVMAASAARNAASDLWKASERSYMLALMRSCSPVPRMLARPMMVTTSSSTSATIRATPRWRCGGRERMRGVRVMARGS